MTAPTIAITANKDTLTITCGERSIQISKLAFRNVLTGVDLTEPPTEGFVINNKPFDLGVSYVVKQYRYVLTSGGTSLSISKHLFEVLRNKLVSDPDGEFNMILGGRCCD